MSADDPSIPAAANGSAFPSTQWTMIVRAGDAASPAAHAALESLCRQYWFPLYAFVRREGRSHHEAEDCTQEFLGRLLAGDGIGRARADQGRFRTFLLAGMRNFLINQWRHASAEKRGGGRPLLPLEFEDAERSFNREPADPALTPERIFDRTWALGMIERTLAELRKDYEKSGRGVLFAALSPLVWDDGCAGETLAAPAARLAMSTQAFTMALHRLRQRIGQRLRVVVAETVATPEEVDRELNHLISALSSR
ncbi:MAG: sigma-70 family RNA polymerase sigma factor [Opitutaceae bacterium]